MKQISEDFVMNFKKSGDYVIITAYNDRKHRISIESKSSLYSVVDVTINELKQLRDFLDKIIEKIESDKDFNKEH